MTTEKGSNRDRGFYLKTIPDQLNEMPVPHTSTLLNGKILENSAASSIGTLTVKMPCNVDDADYRWLLSLNTDYLNHRKCRCQDCLHQFMTFPSKKIHIAHLVSAWTTLRDLIREIYLNPPMSAKKDWNIIEDNSWLCEVLQWLRMTEPYQLLRKIEEEVFAVVLAYRSELLVSIKDEAVQSFVGEALVTGLIEHYVKLMSSAVYIGPLIEALLSPQLNEYQLTWEMMNKCLYLSLIYEYEEVKQMWPTGYYQLKKAIDSKDEYYERLYEQFVTLDREMDFVDESRRTNEPRIAHIKLKKSNEAAKVKRMQALLKGRLSTQSKSRDRPDDAHICSKVAECSQEGPMPWPDFCQPHRPTQNLQPHHNHADAEAVLNVSTGQQVSKDHHDDLVKGYNGLCKHPHTHDSETPVETEAGNVVEPEAGLEETSKTDVSHRASRNNPYLNSEYSHLYSVLQKDNAQEKSLILKALTGNMYPLLKDRRKTSNPVESSLTICKENKANLTAEQRIALLNEAVKDIDNRLTLAAEMREDHGSPHSNGCTSKIAAENQMTCEGRPVKISSGKKVREKNVNEDKIKGKRESVVRSGGGCEKPGVCNSCTKPSTSTIKNTEKHLAAIARLGISKNPSKHSMRCSEHSKCRMSEEPVKKSSSGAVTEYDSVDDDGFSSQDDSCSERSTCTSNSASTTHKDPKHCDCCYCEVFGHAVQTVAPVSRNYQEARERLRLRLNMKKKAMRSSEPAVKTVADTKPTATAVAASASAKNTPVSASGPALSSVNIAPAKPLPTTAQLSAPTGKSEKVQDLDSLLQFIEGNLKDDCIDEKKIAKRARQKQKKIEEKEEKERQEREAERLRLEALKLLSKKSKKAAKKERQRETAAAAAASAAALAQKTANASSSNSAQKMVTIRRVIEPYNPEPTVTITIKGASSDKDKFNSGPSKIQPCVTENKNSSKKKKMQGKLGMEMDMSDIPVAHQQRVMEMIQASSTTKKQSAGNKSDAAVPVSNVPHVTLSKVDVKKGEKKPAYQHSQMPDIAITTTVTQQLEQQLNLENLRLPPGITITKIEAPKPKVITASDSPGPVTRPTPMPPPLVITHAAPLPPSTSIKQPTSRNVIVVETNQLKQVIKESGMTSEASKKKKNKKKKGSAEVTVAPSKPDTEPMLMSQQATIIKTSDNMVTIRSPQLQRAIDMQEERVGVNGLNDKLMGMRLDTDGQLIQQMTRLTLADARLPVTAATAPNNQSKKKKKRRGKASGSEDDGTGSAEQPENVFEPKDIDLDNGEMDEDEREVEAFKRFCLQSVPAARKDKVKVNLNIKDIVLKKKSSVIGCS